MSEPAASSPTTTTTIVPQPADQSGVTPVAVAAAPRPTTTTPAPAARPTTTTPAPAAADPAAAAAPAAAAKPEPEKQPDLARGFAALTRKEQALVQRDRELAAREQALRTQSTELQQLTALRERVKTDPVARLELLQQFGVTYEELTDAMLAHGGSTAADAKVAALEQQIVKDKREREDRETQAKIDAFRGALKNAIDGSGEKYELIAARGAHDEVFALIAGHHEKFGVVMEWQRAAELIENELLEVAVKAAASKKVAARLKPAPAANSEARQDQSESGSRTLTNGDTTAGPPMLRGRDGLPLDPTERNKAIARRNGWIA